MIKGMSITENIKIIEERIQKSCDLAGRKRGEITLMAVSKFEPEQKIKEAFNAGIRFFGESRVKEAGGKFSDFNNDYPGASLHLIGSLQRNKAKNAVLLFDCIQSADRDDLILELAKHSSLRQSPLDILLEVHTGEESKSGYESLDELFKAAELVIGSDKLKPQGLMTMAPFTTDKNIIRSSFKKLFNAGRELEKRFPCGDGINWSCLSMGMSDDFEIAIEEGSTMLRIGSAIFKD